MQQVLGYSPIETGLAYLPLALTAILASGAASNLSIVVVLAAATNDLGGEAESGLASGLVNTTQIQITEMRPIWIPVAGNGRVALATARAAPVSCGILGNQCRRTWRSFAGSWPSTSTWR
jgi:hypothetical protein